MNSRLVRGVVCIAVAGLALAAFSSTALATVFYSSTFTGDGDSGISSSKIYTHAANVRGAVVTINGVPFETGDASGTNWTLANATSTNSGSGAGGVTGNVGQLFNDFRYGPTDGVATLTLTNLTPGQTYTATWYNKAWGNQGERIVKVAGSDGFATSFDENLGGNNAGNLLSARYVAPATGTYSFNFYNASAAFHHYGFSNEESSGATAPPRFETATYNGDADCGIEISTLYTHTVDSAGTAALRYVNGVMFERAAAPVGGDTSGTNWTITGANSGWTGSSGNVTGGIGTLISDFWYNGNPQTVTLTGLVPGAQYETTFYNRAFGNPGTRTQTVTVDNGAGGPVIDEILFDEDFSGAGNGNMLKYRYTAPASGMLQFSFTMEVPASFHHYAFSNEVIPEQRGRLLLTDSFNSGTNENNVSHNVADRQTGALAPVTYYEIGSDYQQQVGNTANVHPHSLLLADGGSVMLNHNFNGAESELGLKISFDLDPNWNPDSNWGALTLGAENPYNGAVNGSHTHFGVLFRGDGRLQAFDANANQTPTEPLWGGVSGQFHHFDVIVTDPTDNNPFDGVGQTTIEIFVDGGTLPVYSFTKGGGGYADNFIGFQGSYRAEFDNLMIFQTVPEPSSIVLLSLAGLGMLAVGRRRRRPRS